MCNFNLLCTIISPKFTKDLSHFKTFFYLPGLLESIPLFISFRTGIWGGFVNMMLFLLLSSSLLGECTNSVNLLNSFIQADEPHLSDKYALNGFNTIKQIKYRLHYTNVCFFMFKSWFCMSNTFLIKHVPEQ